MVYIRTGFTVILFSLSGCLFSPSTPPTRPPSTPTPTQAPASDWQLIANGIELQTIVPNGNRLAEMVTLRINPNSVVFRAHYRRAEPLTLNGWKELLPDALAFVNANFFTPENTVLGLLISDGVGYGQSYVDRGGTFYAESNGRVGIRLNQSEPYRGEAWQTAVQAFPVLVADGLPAYANTRDTRGSRRTIIGIDNEGRILLMSTNGIGLGLYPLSQFLPTAEIGLVRVFNLDGGRSTMLWLQPTNYGIASFEPVPSVLAIYPR